MAELLAYNYAIIDDTGFCYEVRSTSECRDGEQYFVAIPEYNTDYIFKYYNTADGKWYYDAAFTNEWIPE